MDIAKMNAQQALINAIVANNGQTEDQTLVNVAQYISTATRKFQVKRDDTNAEEHDTETVARGKLIQDWLDSMFDLDAATYEVPAAELHDLHTLYLRYTEYLAMQQFMK